MSQPPEVPPDPFEKMEYLQEDVDPVGFTPARHDHRVLNYATPQRKPPNREVGFAGHAVLGAASYFLILVGGIAILRSRGGIAMGIAFVGLANIFTCAIVERTTGWRGFKVGVLIAFPLSCLIGVGSVAVLCGWLK